jgi:hypothetical protein
MRKASTELLEQGTQTPSPAPDLIPAEETSETGIMNGKCASRELSQRGGSNNQEL